MFARHGGKIVIEKHLSPTEKSHGQKIAEYQRDTAPGQAHWAGSGPKGKRCSTCTWVEWKGFYSNKAILKPITCGKFKAMTSRAIPFHHEQKACIFYAKGGEIPKRT